VKSAPLMLCALAACNAGAKAAKGPNAHPIRDEVVRALCTSDTGGDASTIRVWRENDGTFVTMELSPDIAKHGPHAPTVFFDESGREMERIRGREMERIPSTPVEPGSPKALEGQRRRENVVADGIAAETIACKPPEGAKK
jgi:hypothetical protein